MNDPQNTIIHLPTPGDHYSPSSGSAVMTIIHQYAKLHAAEGRTTKIIVGADTRHDYEVGECIEVPFKPLPSRNKKIVDVLLARCGLPRINLASVYKPAINAVSANFVGGIVVHNAAVPIGGLKAAAPHATVAAYFHNVLFNTYNNSEVRRVLAPADTIICVSGYIRDDLNSRLGTTDNRIKVILNGVNIDQFQPGQSPAPDESPIIMFLGRVVAEKGPDLLLRAAARIANGKRKFKIRIVGSNNFSATDPLTEYEQSLRKLAAPISDYVEFIPFVDRSKVVDMYHQATVFCAPSNWDDPCPLTVPEAMACGLPIVASRRGGIPEEGQEAIMYFDTAKIDDLAAHLEHLIDNPGARAEWGKKARARAEEISWQRQYQLLWHTLNG